MRTRRGWGLVAGTLALLAGAVLAAGGSSARPRPSVELRPSSIPEVITQLKKAIALEKKARRAMTREEFDKDVKASKKALYSALAELTDEPPSMEVDDIDFLVKEALAIDDRGLKDSPTDLRKARRRMRASVDVKEKALGAATKLGKEPKPPPPPPPPPPPFNFGCDGPHTVARAGGDYSVEVGFCKNAEVDTLVVEASQGGITRNTSAFIIPAGRTVPCQLMANSTVECDNLAMQPTEALDVGVGGPGVADGKPFILTLKNNQNKQQSLTAAFG